MKPVDIGATIGHDGVSIKLPRLLIDVSVRQAERLRDALNAALPRTAAEAAKQRTSHYLLSIAGDVDPELSEPFATDRERVEAAQDYRRAHGDEDGLYRLDLNHGSHVAPITLDTFRGWELGDAEAGHGDRRHGQLQARLPRDQVGEHGLDRRAQRHGP